MFMLIIFIVAPCTSSTKNIDYRATD